MADPLDLLERIEAQLSNCRTCYDMRDHDHLCKGCSDNVLELLKEAAKTLASRQEVEHGAVVGGVEGSSRDPRADRDAGANDDARTIVASRQEACGYCGMIPHRDGVHFYAPTGASRQEAQPQADWIKMARCSHANAAGGNDYILCNDCGLMWDYRKETANDGLVNFIKLNPLPASPREEARPHRHSQECFGVRGDKMVGPLCGFGPGGRAPEPVAAPSSETPPSHASSGAK